MSGNEGEVLAIVYAAVGVVRQKAGELPVVEIGERWQCVDERTKAVVDECVGGINRDIVDGVQFAGEDGLSYVMSRGLITEEQLEALLDTLVSHACGELFAMQACGFTGGGLSVFSPG